MLMARVLSAMNTVLMACAHATDAIVEKRDLTVNSAEGNPIMNMQIAYSMTMWSSASQWLRSLMSSESVSDACSNFEVKVVIERVGAANTVLSEYYKRLYNSAVSQAVDLAQQKASAVDDKTPNYQSCVNENAILLPQAKKKFLEDPLMSTLPTKISQLDDFRSSAETFLAHFSIPNVKGNAKTSAVWETMVESETCALTAMTIKAAINLIINHSQNEDVGTLVDQWLGHCASPKIHTMPNALTDAMNDLKKSGQSLKATSAGRGGRGRSRAASAGAGSSSGGNKGGKGKGRR